MRPWICAVLFLASACSSAPPPSPVPAGSAIPACAQEHPPAGALAAVAFLAGTWADRGAELETEEHWTEARGDTMLGVNRTVKGGRTVHHEFLMIEPTPEGVVYRARPSGQEPATFRLTSSGPGRATFENPQHDFPQRITYELVEGGVRATVEGTQDGKPRRESWTWRRVGGCR